MNPSSLPTTDLLTGLAPEPGPVHDPLADEQRRVRAAEIVEGFVQQAALSTLDSVLSAAGEPGPDTGRRLRLLADQIADRSQLLDDEVRRFLALDGQS